MDRFLLFVMFLIVSLILHLDFSDGNHLVVNFPFV
jgi:hypothetical protein